MFNCQKNTHGHRHRKQKSERKQTKTHTHKTICCLIFLAVCFCTRKIIEIVNDLLYQSNRSYFGPAAEKRENGFPFGLAAIIRCSGVSMCVEAIRSCSNSIIIYGKSLFVVWPRLGSNHFDMDHALSVQFFFC